MPDDGSNRRVFPRAEEAVSAWYQVGEGQFKRCTALDLGVQGACLRLEEPLPDVEELEVCFELTSDWLVRARAKPIWKRLEGEEYLVGITYKPLRSADKHLIGPWVQKRRRKANT